MPDADGDGVLDASDNCATSTNSDQVDTNNDGQGDACDGDDDGDGAVDSSDNCLLVPNADQADADGDGEGDACEGDYDGDSVLDTTDNCVTVENTDQADLNADGEGDACDADDDGDGLTDLADGCPRQSAPGGCPVMDPGGNDKAANVDRAGRVRTRRAGRRGFRVITGFKVACPDAELECPVQASLVLRKAASAARLRRLGRVRMEVQPGATKKVKIKLSKRGAKALRKKGRLKVRIKVAATGPDGERVVGKRRAKIKLPA
jgi:hypothetical protein